MTPPVHCSRRAALDSDGLSGLRLISKLLERGLASSVMPVSNYADESSPNSEGAIPESTHLVEALP